MKVQNSFSVPQNLQSTAGTDTGGSKSAGSAGLDQVKLPPALRHFDSTFVIPKAQQHKGGPSNSKVATGPEQAKGGPYNLTNHGGAVLTKPVIHNIYIGSYWNSGQGAKDKTENEAMAKDFGQSKMMDVAKQYGAGATSLGNSTVVSEKSPKKMTDADIQKAVKTALAQGQVTKDAQGLYTVVLPPGTVLDAGGGVTSKGGLGGYHGSFDDGHGNPVYYAAIAYSDTKGNGINFDGKPQDNVNITESHEWMEAMTDPDVNSTIPGRGLGWYDDVADGEIGDLMMPQELQAGRPIGQSFEKDAGGFMQQMEWSNKDKLFEIDTAGNRTKAAGNS